MTRFFVRTAVVVLGVVVLVSAAEAEPMAATATDAGTGGGATLTPPPLAFSPLQKGEHITITQELSIATESTPKVGSATTPPIKGSSQIKTTQTLDVVDVKSGSTTLKTFGPVLEGQSAPNDAPEITFELLGDGGVVLPQSADADAREIADLSSDVIRRVLATPRLFQNGPGAGGSLVLAAGKALLVAGYEVADGTWSLQRKSASTGGETYGVTVTGCSGPIQTWSGQAVIGLGFGSAAVDLRGSALGMTGAFPGLDKATTDIKMSISSRRLVVRQSGGPVDPGGASP